MTIVAPFYLYQFGTTEIPGAQGAFGFPAQVRSTSQRTLGGNFDGAGALTLSPELPYALNYTGLVVHATDTTQIRTELDALRALRGQLDRLWLRTADGYDRWAWARLLNVSPEMRAVDRAAVQFVMGFEVRSLWNGAAHGGAWTFDDGYYFDNGLYFDTEGAHTLNTLPKTLTITNNGNVAVDNCGITITAVANAITALKIGIAGVCEFTFTGTIAAGTSLVVDCGNKTVLNNGLDAWRYFALTAAHTIEPWLRLAPGANSVVVTPTPASTTCTAQFTYSDGWA